MAFRVSAFSLHVILVLSPELVGIGSQRARNFSTSSSDKRVPM